MRHIWISPILVLIIVCVVGSKQDGMLDAETSELRHHDRSLRQNVWRDSWETTRNLVEAAALLPARHYNSNSPTPEQEKGEVCLLEPEKQSTSTKDDAVVRIRQKGGDTLPLPLRDRLQNIERMLGKQRYDEDDIETKEGAKILADSLGLVSTTLGLVADTVRVSGDTTAGVLGSSVRLLGGSIKTMSKNLHRVDRLLMPPSEEEERGTRGQVRPVDRSLPRSRLTTHRLIEQRRRSKQEDNQDLYRRKSSGGLVRSGRKVASRGVRLVGNVVQGLGESLVLVGGATESFTASTFGLAEDSVRILEDVAGILSTSVLPKTPKRLIREPDDETDTTSLPPYSGSSKNPYVSFGEKPTNDTVDETKRGRLGSSSSDANPDEERSMEHSIRMAYDWLESYFEFAFKSTEGVPSMATDLLLVLGLSYICVLAALYYPRVRWSVSRVSQAHSTHSRRQTGMKRDDSGPIEVVSSFISRAVGVIIGLVMLPLRILWFLIRLAINRKSVLLYIHIGAWMYLSRASQLRSAAIQRHAENEGFRVAIESIGTTSPSIEESVVWLNSLLGQIWRVPEPSSVKYHQYKYPSFVERAILSKQEESMCKRNETMLCPETARYGGFEPYLSSSIGNNLILVLESIKKSRPSDLAYISVHSFTLGSRPPLIRHIELLGKEDGSDDVTYMIDINAILEDATLILDVKLSNLDYAMIPSTKVSVHSLEVNLPLKVTVAPLPHYPFISRLDFSLTRLPECNVRITPKSKDSALVGVDLGSLPIIREFVQGALQKTLSGYVSPKFISIDFPSWLRSGKATSRSVPRTDLSNLRRHRAETLDPVRATERTRSPLPIALMIRPKTERSEMALKLWLARQHAEREDE